MLLYIIHINAPSKIIVSAFHKPPAKPCFCISSHFDNTFDLALLIHCTTRPNKFQITCSKHGTTDSYHWLGKFHPSAIVEFYSAPTFVESFDTICLDLSIVTEAPINLALFLSDIIISDGWVVTCVLAFNFGAVLQDRRISFAQNWIERFPLG